MVNSDDRFSILRNAVKRMVSVETQITGPLDAKNDKQYYKVSFKIVEKDDDGYIGQSRLYTKCFFEDSHSLLFLEAQRCQEKEIPMKIKAARIILPTNREFYILDEDGKKMPKKNGGFRKASSITLFLMEDENPETAFNQRVEAISAQGAWIEPDLATEEYDSEKVIEQEVVKDKPEKTIIKNGKK